MSVIHAPVERPVTLRHLVVPAILLVATLAFVARLWYWQVVKGEEYKQKATQSGRISTQTLAPRGKIFDRNGVLIADVEPKVVVTGKPAVLAMKPEITEKVAEILQTNPKKLQEALYNQRHKGSLDVPIYVGTSMTKAAMIAESRSQLPGVDVDTQPMRVYRDGAHFSHILGHVAIPTEAIELRLREAGIEPASYVGRDGIEQVYEKDLMGTAGERRYAVDLARKPIRSLGSDTPQPGDNLILSLDRELQVLADQVLGDRKGAIVALDPRNGEVLLMVSKPTYDLSIFDEGLTQAEADYLYQNPDRPMYKRAIAGLYPPGSTSKIMTTIAGAMSGQLDGMGSVSCPGYLRVGRSVVRCENHAAGSLNYSLAFTKSCNSFFGKLAQRSGPEMMRRALEACGIGRPTGIDINGEKEGLVPTEETLRKAHGRPWSAGDTNNIGIGQGDLLASPLQMANVAAMVANRGTVYRPHVVRAFVPPLDGAAMRRREREVLFDLEMSDSVWDKLQSAMLNVTVAGTARAAQIPGVPVAGKTGSAENPQYRKTHAWLVGYAPAQNPTIAFACVVEGAGHGGEIAAPMMQKILKAYFDKTRPGADNTIVAVNR